MENEDAERHRKSADEAAERSITAIEDLIVFTLKAGAQGQFQEAKRLCEVAQSLLRARGKRAGDFQGDVPTTAEELRNMNQYHQFHAAQATRGQVYGTANIVTTNMATPFTFTTTANTTNAVVTNFTT